MQKKAFEEQAKVHSNNFQSEQFIKSQNEELNKKRQMQEEKDRKQQEKLEKKRIERIMISQIKKERKTFKRKQKSSREYIT